MSRRLYRHPRLVEASIRSLIPVVCPNAGSGLDNDIVAHTAASLGAAPRHIRAALSSGVIAYELGAIAYPKVGAKPAHELPISERAKYFHWWWSSPLGMQRELVKALKSFIALAYYEHPKICAELDYDPDGWTDKVKRRRLATYSEPIAAHQRSLLQPDPLPSGFFEPRPARKVEQAS